MPFFLLNISCKLDVAITFNQLDTKGYYYYYYFANDTHKNITIFLYILILNLMTISVRCKFHDNKYPWKLTYYRIKDFILETLVKYYNDNDKYMQIIS